VNDAPQTRAAMKTSPTTLENTNSGMIDAR
jgi:hypothetical protein